MFQLFANGSLSGVLSDRTARFDPKTADDITSPFGLMPVELEAQTVVIIPGVPVDLGTAHKQVLRSRLSIGFTGSRELFLHRPANISASWPTLYGDLVRQTAILVHDFPLGAKPEAIRRLWNTRLRSLHNHLALSNAELTAAVGRCHSVRLNLVLPTDVVRLGRLS